VGRSALTVAVAVLALLLAGCGESRTPIPNASLPASPHSPRAFAHVSSAALGISFWVPRDWARLSRSGVVFVTSGSAVISLQRYSSSVAVAALEQARHRLIAVARRRDHTLRLIRSKLTRVGGVNAIVLDATETIDGARRRVRSLHLFVPAAEIVIEEYAPLALFRVVDHYVFSPLNHTLRLLSPRA
jgi:hypothetical protein